MRGVYDEIFFTLRLSCLFSAIPACMKQDGVAVVAWEYLQQLLSLDFTQATTTRSLIGLINDCSLIVALK